MTWLEIYQLTVWDTMVILGNHCDSKSYNGENSYVTDQTASSVNITKMFVVTRRVPKMTPKMSQVQDHNQDL